MISSYDLDLDVDFREAIIRGTVAIRAADIGDSIDLDAKELIIAEVTEDGSPVPFIHENNTLRLSKIAGSKEHVFVIRYEKKIRDDTTTGVYKSRYGNEYFIATDFEPDRARTFFPCKDEPSWKAVFNLRVVTEEGLKVISNAPLKGIEDTDDPKKKRHVFEPTPMMSTYLFFMGVGRFSEVSRSPAGGPTVTVAARPGATQRAAFILELAASALRESGEYFGVPYPLKKLHLIALPEYGGAMENWGAIISYESGLLVGEGAGAYRRRIAAVITTHEIQHQWFGDLVTMKWWDDIWLNESFATFMSYKIVDRLHPEWNCWGDFLSLGLDSMAVDQLQGTHPIQAKIVNPAEMNEVFDRISYGKGASVIRMIESFLGEDAFRRGITEYIRKFSYHNARSEDLWESLEKASGQPVSKIMGSWITKPGFPLLSVERDHGKLILSQRRFQLTGEAGGSASVWPIPLNVQINGKMSKFLLDSESKEVDLGGEELRLVKANVNQAGYYCVKYDEGMYEALANSFSSLGGLDKAGLVNDLFQLMKAGEVAPSVYFRFLELCKSIDDYTTLLLVSNHLRLLWSIASSSKEVGEAYRSFCKAQLGRLTLSPREEDSENDGLLRGRFASMLTLADESFAKQLAPLFSGYPSLDSNMKTAVAMAYARTEGEAAFDALTETLLKMEDEAEREMIYAGLVAFDDPALVVRTLDLVASGRVSRSDSYWPLLHGQWNPAGHQAEWGWIVRNQARLGEMLGSDLFVLTLLQLVAPIVALESREEAKAFFTSGEFSKRDMSTRQILELLSVYSGLRSRLGNSGIQ